MPAMARFGYAVGVVSMALQHGCAGEELKDAILRYVWILRYDVSDAETTEIAQKLLHRELLCGDMLSVLMGKNTSSIKFELLMPIAGRGISNLGS